MGGSHGRCQEPLPGRASPGHGHLVAHAAPTRCGMAEVTWHIALLGDTLVDRPHRGQKPRWRQDRPVRCGSRGWASGSGYPGTAGKWATVVPLDPAAAARRADPGAPARRTSADPPTLTETERSRKL